MIDGNDIWPAANEPSPADFEAADAEAAKSGLAAMLLRWLRAVVALVIIVALILYFVAPLGDVFSGHPYRLRPLMRTRTIPLAPGPKSAPTQAI